MAKINTKTRGARERKVKDPAVRLAGGMGNAAAVQDDEARLRRAVLANLLWENTFYMDGKAIADVIAELVPKVEPSKVAALAIEARVEQKLRHIPLFLAREMARHPEHRKLVGALLPQIITRADQITDFLALYWKDGKQPLAKQVKVGLSAALGKFNEYEFAKYNRETSVKLRDVLFMVHATPKAQGLETGQRVEGVNRKDYRRGSVMRHAQSLFGKLVRGKLAVPDTWEVGLSAAKTTAEKRAVWERLIKENKLGALAFLRNLRNMELVGVSADAISSGFRTLNPKWLLPVNYFAAAQHAPKWEREIETLMLRGLAAMPKLTGTTILVLDVSGSMSNPLSENSKFTRLQVGGMLAAIALELCERVVIYATAGSDGERRHKTQLMRPRRGFALLDEVEKMQKTLGGGGIFTQQALEYVRDEIHGEPVERIIVLSDSQDTDFPSRRIPAPFGKYNYIVDVSNHIYGINYGGVWTAEISGWSENFMRYIAASEGVNLAADEESTAD